MSSLRPETQRIIQKLLLNCYYCSLPHFSRVTKNKLWGNSFNVFIIFWLIISLFRLYFIRRCYGRQRDLYFIFGCALRCLNPRAAMDFFRLLINRRGNLRGKVYFERGPRNFRRVDSKLIEDARDFTLIALSKSLLLPFIYFSPFRIIIAATANSVFMNQKFHRNNFSWINFLYF